MQSNDQPKTQAVGRNNLIKRLRERSNNPSKNVNVQSPVKVVEVVSAKSPVKPVKKPLEQKYCEDSMDKPKTLVQTSANKVQSLMQQINSEEQQIKHKREQ